MSTSYASCSILQRAQVRCSFQSGFPCLVLLIGGGLTPTRMARCFCAMGLTEHAAQDLETLRRDAESAYRQMSRSDASRQGWPWPPFAEFPFLDVSHQMSPFRVQGQRWWSYPTSSRLVVLPHLQLHIWEPELLTLLPGPELMILPGQLEALISGPHSSPRWNACFSHGRHGLAGLPFLPPGWYRRIAICKTCNTGGHELAD